MLSALPGRRPGGCPKRRGRPRERARDFEIESAANAFFADGENGEDGRTNRQFIRDGGASSKLSDEELIEIAYLNDTPPAFKARAELQRRNSEFNARTLFWARLAGVAAVAALVMTIISALT